jgi:hypothetical protein
VNDERTLDLALALEFSAAWLLGSAGEGRVAATIVWWIKLMSRDTNRRKNRTQTECSPSSEVLKPNRTIGRAMHMSGWWGENCLSREELEAREVDLEMRGGLGLHSRRFQDAALMNNHIAVIRALAARWVDGAWHDSITDGVDENPCWRRAALAPEAKRLVELVQGTDEPLTRCLN